MGWAGIRVKRLKPGSQGKKVEKVFACVDGWLFVSLFVDGFGFCCCCWLAGWLFRALLLLLCSGGLLLLLLLQLPPLMLCSRAL
jgi:hypothetical protein